MKKPYRPVIFEDPGFADPRPPAGLAGERRRLSGRGLVPRDAFALEKPVPATGGKGVRFLFLSDAHSIAPLAPIQQRVAGWCARRVREWMPDAVILGGDITHRPLPEQARAFLGECAVAGFPTFYLPGDNEGPNFCHPDGVQPVTACRKLEWAGRVWLLPTSTAEQASASVEALLAELPPGETALVFAHFPPELAGTAALRRLENAPGVIHWICGHRHRAWEERRGSLRVTICAGLDPVKACGSGPEILEVDWDGETPVFRRSPVPNKVLNPPGRPPVHWAGVAFRGTGEALLRLALERNVPALQFHYQHSTGAPAEIELELAREYRRQIRGSFLSLHLPNFPHPAEGPDLADQEAHLQFAEGIGVNDLTVHLPAVPAGLLYDRARRFRDTDWARGCLQTYAELSARALRMGAQISFENVYNKRLSPPGEERLGSQPWQLLHFVEEVRRRLRDKDGADFSPEAVERVGIIFDAGHAFADVHYARHHGLADWLIQVAPYVQLAHIHQVVDKPEGGRKNHQPIGDLHGPLINFQGLLCAFRDAVARPFPLLVEVRDEGAALESYATLQRSDLLRSGPDCAANPEPPLPVFPVGGAEKAFSLMEMLVAIGIVGVLAALILPVLGTMQTNALTAKCAANLRSLAEAGRLYANDHNGEFTSVNYINGVNDDPAGFREYAGLPRRTTGMDTVFTCPSLQKDYRTTAYALNHNYALNQYASTDYTLKGKDKAIKRFVLVAKPASMAYFMDSIPALNTGQSWYFSADVTEEDYLRFVYPHRHAQQVIFLDGHLELLSAAQVEKRCTDAVLSAAFWRGQ